MANINDEIRNDLHDALVNGDIDASVVLTQRALEQGAQPLDLIQQVIVPTLTKIGQDFQDFVIFLPELMSAGDAAEKATAILEQAMVSSGQQVSALGTVVIGTVENDVHDIGKNIVCTLLRSHGFKVVDLGRDVAPSAFLEAAQKEKADIIAMSSLMTTTRPSTRSTINLFTEVNQRQNYKFVVGGGCITPEWADEIGADGYAPDAAAAVELCKTILAK
ncbi:MAG TPA: cobalamin-dependent protein [Anaerolineales bacterium]|nr:cobalamin-dependent protein [Anaerolineales bacterium]